MLLQIDNPIEISISIALIGGIIAGWYYLKKNDQHLSRKILRYIASGSGLAGLLIFIFTLQLEFTVLPYIGIALLILAFSIYPKREEDTENLPEDKKAQWQVFYQKEYDTTMTKGIASYNRKAFDAANGHFIQALKMNPTSAEAWFYLGEINFFRKRFAEAKTAFE